MKAITLYQPWATLVVLGAKKIETRSWGTKYRGPLAIHASQKFTGRMKLLMFQEPFFSALKEDLYFDMEGDLPTGCIVGSVALVGCRKIDLITPLVLTDREKAFGNYTPGRFMWFMENSFRSVLRRPTRGKLGLWEWEGDRG